MTKQTIGFLRAIVAGGLLLFSGHAATALAADITVCPSGCNYSTIQDGITNAIPPATVFVGTPGRTTPETYNENITMQNGVNLVSEGDDTTAIYTDTLGGTGYTTTVLKRATMTIIHGGGDGAVVTFLIDAPSDGTLDGFTIENVSEQAGAYFGLVMIGNSSPTIKNNIIRNNRGSEGLNGGIMMGSYEPTISPTIEHNVIHYVNGPGIGIRSFAHPTIRSNEIFTTPPSAPQYAPGIGLSGAASAIILNNRIFKNGRAGIGSTLDMSLDGLPSEYGLQDTGFPIVIQGNYVHDNPVDYGNGAGVRLSGAAAGSANVEIVIGGENPSESNQFSRNKAGVYIDHEVAGGRILSATIENNDFQNNRIAVRVENVDSVTIDGNDMYNQIEYCAIRTENIHTLIVEDNEMRDNAKCGMRIWNNDGSSPNLSIQGNNIFNSAFGGLALDNDGMHGTISGNHVYQNGYGGILIHSSNKNVQLDILNNEIDHNLRGGIHTGGLSLQPVPFDGTPGIELLIRGNKVHHNGQGNLGGGIDVRHASISIENNLVYKNNMGGIRYGDFIRSINHNTVVGNGQSGGAGAGIAFDNAYSAPLSHQPPQGSPVVPVADIRNNILANNKNAGVNAGTVWDPSTCPNHIGHRQYNLYSANNGQPASLTFPRPFNTRPQLGTCNPNTGEIFLAPKFLDEANEDYHLQPTSPAVDAGDPVYLGIPPALVPDDIIPPGMGTTAPDMGAYGGQNPITW